MTILNDVWSYSSRNNKRDSVGLADSNDLPSFVKSENLDAISGLVGSPSNLELPILCNFFAESPRPDISDRREGKIDRNKFITSSSEEEFPNNTLAANLCSGRVSGASA